MKLTNTVNKSKRGVTLLELTVVILVLLSLIGILFVGVNAWKRGSDRSQAVLTMRNAQQAVRGIQNTFQAAPGATEASVGLVIADLVFGNTSNVYIQSAAVGAVPAHPAGGTNTYDFNDGTLLATVNDGLGASETTFPGIGYPYIYTSSADTFFNPAPADLNGW